MPETFKDFGISNMDFLVAPMTSEVIGEILGSDIGEEYDGPDEDFDGGDEIDIPDDWPIDEPGGIFEELWEIIKDLF